MSTSGYFDGAKSSYGWYARLEYSYTQTTTTNITLTLKVYNGTKPAYNNNANSAYYVIAGDKVYKTYSWTSIGWNTLGSKTVSVSANATSYNASAQWVSDVNSTYTPSSLSVSGTIEFPKINLLTVSAPSSVTVEEDETATFSVTASGGSSYTYQWYFGGSAVSITTIPHTQKLHHFLIMVSRFTVKSLPEAILLHQVARRSMSRRRTFPNFMSQVFQITMLAIQEGRMTQLLR